jgi:hypothetical protein
VQLLFGLGLRLFAFFLEITRETVKVKILTQEGVESILQAKGNDALLIANILDEVWPRHLSQAIDLDLVSG